MKGKIEQILTYEHAMAYLEDVNQYGSVLGLDSMRELLGRLGNPQDNLNYVHVAGTNGKGSTSAYISYILSEAGYLVGRYSSPAVFTYWERIQITDQNSTTMISQESVTRHLSTIKEAADSMLEEGIPHPTIFEIETALAFLEFLDRQCDIVVLEVGMGGRLDATNVIKNTLCAVITSISMDHMQFLGDTLEKIAYEKAGIIKEGCQVVTSNGNNEVLTVIRDIAEQQHANLVCLPYHKIQNVVLSIKGSSFDYGEFTGIRTGLLGEYQINNATLAIEAALALQNAGLSSITKEAIYSGLQKAKWPGRFQIINQDPLFLIDGAHNDDAAKNLRKSIEMYFSGKRIFYIIGIFGDKDVDSIISKTADLAYKIYTVTPDHPRALPSSQLAKIAEQYCNQVMDVESVKDAVDLVKKEADVCDVIIAFGSLSYLSDIVAAVY